MNELIEALGQSVWEMGEAFKGLPDADVWSRPHPRLLSVGELAAHAAYWEAKTFLPDDFQNPLVSYGARYYSVTVDEPVKLDLGAESVWAEVQKVHAACMAGLLALDPDPAAQNPHREGWTWKYCLQYQAFHFAYHAGQMYSVRHLMGHTTEDN